jgi:beta-glucuronidase
MEHKNMKLRSLLFVLFISSTYLLVAQEQLITNAYNRETTSLNGYWNYIVDPYENGFYNYRYEPFENQKNPGSGAFFTNSKAKTKSDLIEYDFDKMDRMLVPSDWNTQKENLFYYEGTVWFKKSFNYSKSKNNNRVFVYFEASNYETDVYLNGEKLGKHIGGFTPFNFEITDKLKKKGNFLIVKVDNKRKKEAVPTLNTDWWNYGGITRDVKLIETSETFVEDYFIQLDPHNKNHIMGELRLNGTNKKQKKVTISIPELKIEKSFYTDEKGTIAIDINSSNIEYWSLENPFLYDVFIKTDEDQIVDQIGFRSIKTKGAQVLLNEQPIFLKGISIHEESPIHDGRGHSLEDAKQLLTWAQELGCNYVRLAHYPHNEHMVRLADKLGILVWEENPVYWTISWENKQTYKNAKHQLSEVIDRDKNRASVIIWSMANETPTSEARNSFLTDLATYTKEKDPTRLISAALEQSNYQGNPLVRTISDPFAELVDILSFNQYIGWYDGGIEKCSTISWNIGYNKPVIISEFGAGAKYGLHGNKDTRWNEEYQEYLYQETLKMIDQIDQLSGISPWILVDFRSPRRVLPEIQDGWNRKGLISEKGDKKKAFFVLKNYYEHKTSSDRE